MKINKFFKISGILCVYLFGLAHSVLATTKIDQTLDVGAIDGAHAVNLTGAFTYTIPIKIPEGTMGMQPNLSLNYNSQSGNGIAGYGWNLSGTSAISRVNKTIYHDGAVSAPDLSESDALTLDGNRLLYEKNIIEGGKTVRSYKAEMESFQQIRTTDNTQLQSFTVKTKDGKTIEYGNSTDSRLKTEDGSKILVWYINKVTDRNGNYMTYHYTMYGRQIALDKIKYTGNDGNDPDNPILVPFTEISFSYKNRDDKSNACMAGSRVEIYKLLDIIRVETNNTHYKSYKLNHSFSHFNYLTEFQEWGSEITDNGKNRLNSLTFNYEEKDNYNAENYNVTKSFYYRNSAAGLKDVDFTTIPGNFNGDGLQDFLTLRYVKIGGDEGKYIRIELQLNNNKNGSKGFTQVDLTNEVINQSRGHTFMHYLAPDPDNKLRSWIPNAIQPIEGIEVFTGDVNGDNIDDIIIYDQNITTYWYFASNGIGQYKFTGELKVDENNTATLIDVDGDNLLELLVVEKVEFDNIIHLKSFDDRHNRVCKKRFANGTLDPNTFNGTVKDIDGDGKMEYELVHKDSQGSILYQWSFSANLSSTPNPQLCDLLIINGQRRGYIYAQVHGISLVKTSSSKSMPSDFNGDGKADELVLHKTDKKLYLFVNNEGIEPNIPYLESPNNKIYTADVNGDGLTDVFYIKNSSNDEAVFYINKGEGKSFDEFTYRFGGNTFIDSDQDFVQMADFDGDGVVEIFFKKHYEKLYFFELDFGKPTDRLLTSVKDSYTNETKVHYDRLSSEQNYTVNENLVYPLRVLNGPIYVTSKMEIPTNVDNQFGEKTYAYENLIAHLEGKGLLGFKKVTETDNLNEITTESNFELDKKTKVLLLPANSSKKLTTSINYCNETEDPDCIISKLSESIPSYTVDVSALGVKWLRLDQTDAFDYVNKSKTINEYEYYDDSDKSDYRNLKKTISTIYDTKNNSATVNYTTTTDVTYENCEWWIDYLSKTVTTKLERAGYPGSNIRSVEYIYDLENGNLEAENTDPDEAKELFINYEYDDFGNPISTITSAPGETNTPFRLARLVFDDTGRYIVEKYNGVDALVEETTIHPTWGLPETVTDIDENVTSYTYDNYGHVKTTTNYLGITETIIRDWEIDNDLISSGEASYDIATVYEISTVKKNTPETFTYFDKFGREVATKVEFFDEISPAGRYSWSFNKFDDRGRIVAESNPFENGVESELATQTKFTYDDLNRVTTSITQQYESKNDVLSTKDITEKIIFTYTDREANAKGIKGINSDIIEKSTIYDVTGNVISVKDPSGELNYTYNNFNELYQVKDQNDNTLTESGYDDFGRQTTLIDINAGTTTYAYNAFDELIGQTDAKDNTTVITYDNLGRIKTKTITDASGETLNYTYGYNPKSLVGGGKLKLNAETGPDNTAKTYWYDIHGRLRYGTTNVDDKSFVTGYTYNDFGDIESITYPDEFTVNYEYDTNTGVFYKATSDNTVLYEMKAVNHLGQVTGYEYNNGTIPVEHTYNEFGMPNTTKAKNGTLFNWQYNFNKNNGNLNNRRDVKNNKYESFKYDNLHRLTHINNTEVTKYTYNGNIDYKQDAGNYTYSQPNNKINAVTGISNDNNTIPLLTECITYTAFDRPESIVEGNKSYELYYGIDHQRTKSVSTENGKTTTRYYNGAYELIDGGICGISKSIYHLSFANSVDVIYYKEKIVSNECRAANNSELADEFYYVFTDYLGSVLNVVDGDGNTKEEQSFDAWGRKRNPTNWQVYNEPAEALPQTLTWLKRGYTGHEHIYQFGIINMNNRLYDPIVGRMLAVDNFVADSGSTQAFNRYSYAMNNPLKYTDPSGEWVNFVVGAVVGGIVNVVDQALKGNITSFGEGLAYFGVGAGAGLLVASGNIAAARVLTAGGNKAVQLVTGKFDPTGIDSFGDVASLALDVGTDLLAPDLTKVVSKVITKKIALKALAKTAGSAAANNTIKVAGSTLAEKAGGEVAKGIAFNAVAKEGWGVTAKAVDRASRLALHNAGKIGYRAITRGNFRHNLSKLTGINPKGFEAHHIFPHQFKEKFAKIGFDANNPIFGAWFEKGAHRAAHNAGNYNQLWQEFLQQPNLTVDKTLQFGKDLMSNYGNFNFLF